MNRPIGMFDSGIGGKSVLAECKHLLPNERFVYIDDKEHFPYGNKSEEYIKKRVFHLSEKLLFEHDCKAIVVACNTATNVGIKMLRKKYSVPFVGLEPAIRPALSEIKDGKILLLTTFVTTRQKKFKELLNKFDAKNLTISPQKNLAALIENNFDNLDRIYPDIEKMLLPYADVRGIVLGCTHYVFIKDLIDKFFGGNVKIYDGNKGAAKRLISLLEHPS